MKRMHRFLPACATTLLMLCAAGASGQDVGGVYIDPHKGSTSNRRSLLMNANKVESYIDNIGTFGRINNRDYSGAWPRGSGHSHVHQMSIMVSAKVFSPTGQELHISSESFGDTPDRSSTNKEYFWNPLPGYYNDHRRYVDPSTGLISFESQVANSMDTTTYPPTWPGKDASWDRRWNGYFGKDQFNADEEVLYVIDDSYNSEFPYYPMVSDTNWRGLGLQVETRLFQWSHPLAEDQVFIHFQVTNISDYDFDRNIYFGAFADTHPGGLGATDDDSGWDRDENMVFAWDHDGVSNLWLREQNVLPGYLAWKYLESPGFPSDGVDNDRDGLLDEKRDNDAGTWLFGPIGNYGPDKWHWSGDEDGDWLADADDVGSDGIGPFDPAYTEPDADGTEGNGRPDQGEPNFGKTDKDESDQIGLTSFYSPAYGSVHASDDEQIWNFIQPGVFETPAQNSNNMWVFTSGPFTLPKKRTERFSVCWLFGEDRPEIYRNAKTSQQIYNNNYRFTKAPLAPTLTAVPGDRRVTLYWNDVAERSVDPLYGFDFEGYRLYRGTNAQLTEANVITDAFGNVSYKKPIAQFDLKDGIKGLHPLALGTELGEEYSKGIHYYMGDDTGLRHYMVDSSGIMNGVTYYYVLVAYDKGYYPGMDARGLVPTTPSESAYRLVEVAGGAAEHSSNAALVTPNAPSVNYQPGTIAGAMSHASDGSAWGSVQVKVVDPDKLPDGHVFEVSFGSAPPADSGIGVPFATSYSLRDTTAGVFLAQNLPVPQQYIAVDSASLTRPFPWQTYDTVWTSRIFSGLALDFHNQVPALLAIRTVSGWQPGSATTSTVSIDYGNPGAPVAYPLSFDIEITATPSGKSMTTKGSATLIDTYFKITNTRTGEAVPCYLQETLISRNGKWDKNEKLYIAVRNPDGTYLWPWLLNLVVLTETVTPQAGDVYHFVCPAPFTTQDRYTFSTVASSTAQKAGVTLLNRTAVVPNPYILSVAWERSSATNGRGERKIYFIHLPSECTIRIFTQNGTLLRTIRHGGTMADGSETWDLTSEEGLEVAFGIYVYQVETPAGESKIDTFAIIN